MFIHAIKVTTKKLLLNMLHKVLINRNNFEKHFVDIISACVGHSRQYSKNSASNSSRD